MKTIRNYLDRKGQGIVEYALLLSFIVGLAMMLNGANLGGTVKGVFDDVAGLLGGEKSAAKTYADYFNDWSKMSQDQLWGIDNNERIRADREASGYAEQFERGNPAVLAGMSGIELARAVVKKTYREPDLPEARYAEGMTDAYWAGWALALYQWHSARRFKDIFDCVKASDILGMYAVYHEMDSSKFIEAMEKKCSAVTGNTRLRKLRESRGLSQARLAELSGVKLRSIQMYEQRINDIDKAQAQTVYKLSRVIGCSVEDLLENPAGIA